MRTPIPGITSFEQEEMLFDAKRTKQGPKRPYPRVYGQLYKGKVTTDGWDTRVKVCDVETPVDHLKDCSPKCSQHPTRPSEGTIRKVKVTRKMMTFFWDSACMECIKEAFDEGFTVKQHGLQVKVKVEL